MTIEYFEMMDTFMTEIQEEMESQPTDAEMETIARYYGEA